MTKLFFGIQKFGKKVQTRLLRDTSTRHPETRSQFYINKKVILAASGLTLLSVPAAFAIQSQFDTPQTPSSNLSQDEDTATKSDQSKDDHEAGNSTTSSSSQTTVSGATNNVNGSITVNGVTTPLPNTGDINKTITSDDGHSSVHIEIDNQNNGGSSYHFQSNTSSSSSIQSHTSTSSNGGSKQ